MEDTTTLTNLLRHIRGGDPTAAAEVVNRYERVIRAVVRARLTDPALRRQFDSTDVCQSVLASFFVRAAAGLYDFDRPDQLAGLLVRMAEYKFNTKARDAHRQRRDASRIDPGADPDQLATAEPGPAELALHRDLFATVLTRLSPTERNLVERRNAGHTWPEIAAALGGDARAHRRQLGKALNRATAGLGLDGPDDDE